MSILKKVINILNNIILPKNPCIILDIDDTIINSLTNEVNIDVMNVYNLAVSRNIKVFIITARNFYGLSYTYKQLHDIGITDTPIYFMDIYERNIPEYKKNRRKLIKDLGYNCIISIGDMSWDIGEYGGIGILV